MYETYVWNRTHISKNTGTTPYEALFGRLPSLKYIKVFGCDAFVHVNKDDRDGTFDTQSAPGIYLGPDPVTNCPIILLVPSGRSW